MTSGNVPIPPKKSMQWSQEEIEMFLQTMGIPWFAKKYLNKKGERKKQTNIKEFQNIS